MRNIDHESIDLTTIEPDLATNEPVAILFKAPMETEDQWPVDTRRCNCWEDVVDHMRNHTKDLNQPMRAESQKSVNTTPQHHVGRTVQGRIPRLASSLMHPHHSPIGAVAGKIRPVPAHFPQRAIGELSRLTSSQRLSRALARLLWNTLLLLKMELAACMLGSLLGRRSLVCCVLLPMAVGIRRWICLGLTMKLYVGPSQGARCLRSLV